MSIADLFTETFPLDAEDQPVLPPGTVPRENDHAAYEAFDDQVQARVSLASSGFQREVLLEAGARVLIESSRDFKVLVTLGDVLLTSERPTNLSPHFAYLDALARGLGPYWPRLHPLPEARNWIRIRHGLLSQLLTGLERLLKWRFDAGDEAAGERVVAAVQALAALESLTGEWAQTRSNLAALSQRLERHVAQERAPTPTLSEQAPAQASKAAALPPRDLRQAILSLAAYLPPTPSGLEAPLAFALRRKAAFLAFEGEVQAEAGVTALTDIPAERVSEVQAAARTPSFEGLQALEATLQSRPLWLTGHRLASQMAAALGGVHQAQTIRAATCEEAQALGAHITDYHFKDGLPFADRATKHWLKQGHVQAGELGPPPKTGLEEPTAQDAGPQDQDPADKAGDPLEDPLMRFNAGLAGAGGLPTGRASTLALKGLADALGVDGHGAAAALVATHLLAQLKTLDLLDWEKEMTKDLKTLIKRY